MFPLPLLNHAGQRADVSIIGAVGGVQVRGLSFSSRDSIAPPIIGITNYNATISTPKSGCDLDWCSIKRNDYNLAIATHGSLTVGRG